MPVTQYQRREALSEEQLRRLLAFSQDDPSMRDLHDVVILITNTGLRLGELRELRWSGVDLHGHHLFIKTQKKSTSRSIPFESKTLQVLEARRERQSESEYVLGTSPRTVLNRISRQLRTLSAHIGVSRVSLNVLRHTFFTRLFNSGASILTLYVIGGYRSYRHLLKSFVSPEQRYEIAVRDQARMEEQE
jgi:integrase